MNLQLTKSELIALKEILQINNYCNSGCIYSKMQNSKKNCDECKFQKAIYSLQRKIGVI